jgi:hypothetical protein
VEENQSRSIPARNENEVQYSSRKDLFSIDVLYRGIKICKNISLISVKDDYIGSAKSHLDC